MQQVHNAAVVARSLGCQCDTEGTWELVQSDLGYLGPGGVREILPYPSTLVGSSPLPSSYLVPTTFKRNHDKLSYYLKFSAIPYGAC